MTVQELLKKGKNAIRQSDNLASLFSDFYKEYFKGTASFCCTFSDFDRLHKLIFKKELQMGLTKYELKLNPNDKLFYVENKKVHRIYVKRATDDFIDKFLKLHDPNKFKNIHKFIVPLKVADVEEVKEEKPIKASDAIELISIADADDLKQFQGDTRKTVQNALKARLKELEGNE